MELPDNNFLNKVRERALSPDSPTPNCLNSGAVSYYLEYGDLLPSDEEHIKTCVYCRAMLESLGSKKFTLEAGRSVLINGEPGFVISRPSPEPGKRQLSPVQLDRLAKTIVELLNGDVRARMALTESE